MLYSLGGESKYIGKYKGFELEKIENIINNKKEYKIKKKFIITEFDKQFNKLKDLIECIDYIWDCYKERYGE